MPEVSWFKYAKLAGAGFAAVSFVSLLIVIGFSAGVSSGYYDARTDGFSAEYAEQTDRRIENCLIAFDEDRLAACVQQAVSANHENQRSEQDLDAQRDMARWAWWLLAATLLQVPIGVAGLVALLITIYHGRKSLDHAQNVSETQLRAYVYHRKVRLKPDGSGGFRISLRYVNSGQTPAHDVVCGIDVIHMAYPIDETKIPDLVKSPDPSFITIGPGAERRSWKRLSVTPLRQTRITQSTGCILTRLYISYRTHGGASVEEPVTYVITVGPEWEKGSIRLLNRGRDLKK